MREQFYEFTLIMIMHNTKAQSSVRHENDMHEI